MLPKLAIVGRPNVGKSALFNRICKKRIAIVDEEEGITRDRLYAEGELFGKPFLVIDTGGIDPRSPDQFSEEIRRQAQIAIEEADTIVMVVDAHVGITALDEELARRLLRTGKRLTLAVNKVDVPEQQNLLHQFYPLGIGASIAVSATQGLQIAELLESALSGVEAEEAITFPGAKVAVVGRPNVGKSTLINSLASEPRCVVSPIPGTTRDSIDIPIEWEGTPYVLIDTAGIRRKKAEHAVVEKFAAIRTAEAIERCDLVLLVIDVNEGMTAQEKRIMQMIEKAGKGCILLVNKWDTVSEFRMEHCMQALRKENPYLSHCPILFISAKTGRNLPEIFTHVALVAHVRQQRITTHQLNKCIERAIQLNHPPMIRGKRLRIYYSTQVSAAPPQCVLFVNHPDLMSPTYKRYLVRELRKSFGFTGNPLDLLVRESRGSTKRS